MPRRAAWHILRSGSPTPLREVDPIASELGLDDRDRGLVRRLVGSEVRHRGTLRALVQHLAHGRLKPDLAAHLHLGIVQLLYFDRVPDHAAVSATLEAVHQTVGPSKVRVVSGILHAIQRLRREGASGDPRRDLVGRDLHLAEPVFRDPDQHPLLWAEDALSLPAHLMKRWTKRHGRARAEAIARQALSEPPLVVRGVGLAREDVLQALAELEPVPSPVHPRAVRVPSARTAELTATDLFLAGRLTVQGESALLAAELLEARPGEHLLDLCAAPGGKTAVLAEAGARVLAVDVDPRRLETLADTLARLRLAERVTLLAADATEPFPGPETFDGVLVDAPCSNTGVLAARPAARWRFGPQTLRSLHDLQTRLLDAAARRVRPGGRLVWSTCSLEPEENSQLLTAFLAQRPGWQLEAQHESLPADDGPIDGGFAARLRREG